MTPIFLLLKYLFYEMITFPIANWTQIITILYYYYCFHFYFIHLKTGRHGEKGGDGPPGPIGEPGPAGKEGDKFLLNKG
jgi:hypothetical protein